MLKYFVSSRGPIFLRDDSFLSHARVPTQLDLCDDRNAPNVAGAGETYVLNGGDYVLENVAPNAAE